jgi:hypothetical protein
MLLVELMWPKTDLNVFESKIDVSHCCGARKAADKQEFRVLASLIKNCLYLSREVIMLRAF